MFAEAASAPALIAAQRRTNASALAQLATAFRESPPQTVITLGRGSSDNAASFARYLFERRLGLVTGSLAPSVSSIYGASLDFANVLLLAISQSGKSPDLVGTAERAQEQGAGLVALVNDRASPLAQTADCFLDIAAGPELSVAATKTFLLSIAGILDLLRALDGDSGLDGLLDDLPAQLEQAWSFDWSAAIEPLAQARSLFVIARGHALGIAQEMALKLKETCAIHAEAISAAEVRHGPMAIVEAGFPVIVMGQDDETHEDVIALAREFAGRGASVIHSGLSIAEGLALPHLAADPLVAPVLQLQSFYRLCEALARHKGLDPDRPPHLNKVTRTL
jgi:glucosamine--fructose-6-phosphate aminotransferase (isomerizing)